MASGWLRGTVKEVPAGDTVVIIGASKVVPPPEKRITLSSLVAPKLGRRDGTKDEPFAWDSREFLRKKLIGQAVVFKVDYTVEAIGNREFGSVFLGQENVALTVITSGWAKVRAVGSQQSPFIEDLKRAEEAAQQQAVGVWNKDPVALASAVRDAKYEDGFNALEYLNEVGKGKPVPAVVEQVINGSMLRVCLLPDFQQVLVHAGGVQAPSMGRRPTSEADEGTPPEPFAREAKHFTETKTLNREVRVVVEGVDKFNNLFATIYYPEGEQPASLAEQLVSEGYAKTAEWSLTMLTAGAPKLRELERKVKAERKNMWTGYVPVNTGQTKLSDHFVGKVVEVVSGDCLVVKDKASNTERRVNLSSIRAPRVPHGRGAAASADSEDVAGRRKRASALEAKELLRKRFIGQEVQVHMEYTRKVPLNAAEAALNDGTSDRVMAFGNVTLPAAKEGEAGLNAAELIVGRGLADVIRHRADEERSSLYERLVELEEAAKKARKGLHNPKEAPPNRINDVSQPGSGAKAKQHLPFLQRSGKLQAVVEYCLSGHRLKLLIPKEGVAIIFAPSGIKTPMRTQPASNGRPAVKGEPYADEALSFARELIMQRDVEVEIETVDKAGTFLGSLTIPGPRPVHYGLTLLKAGLAKLHPHFAADRVAGGRELVAAEQAAKEARLKVWENWAPEDDAEEGEGPSSSGAGGEANGGGPEVAVLVTEVVDGSEFYVQLAEEPRVAWITEQLATVGLAEQLREAPLNVGSLCLGQFSLDDQWYRAFIERVHREEPRYEVFFIDYGNKERLPSSRVAPMDAALAAVEAQSQACQLAYIKLPPADSEYAPEALGYLQQLVGGGRRLNMKVVARERAAPREKHPRKQKGKLTVVLVDPDSDVSVNANMLVAGLAKLPRTNRIRDPALKAAIEGLLEFEDEARKAHRGMFQYGDPGDSDDEPLAPAPPKAWGRK